MPVLSLERPITVVMGMGYWYSGECCDYLERVAKPTRLWARSKAIGGHDKLREEKRELQIRTGINVAEEDIAEDPEALKNS